MKRQFFLMCAAAAAFIAGTLSASAATEITSGTSYYIQNVESGLFLCGANNWGTRATVSTQGDLFTVEGSAGAYTLTDNDLSSGNKKLGDNLFTDNGGCNWDIAVVTEGVFSIYNSNGYVMQAAEAGYHIGYVAAQAAEVTGAAKWRFLTVEEAKAQLGDATQENPKNASFLIGNANFSRNHTTTWTMVASNQKLCGGVTGGDTANACAESWKSTFTLSQTLTVPNGVYELTAQASVCDYSSTGVDLPVVYANEATAVFCLSSKNNAMDGGENSMDLMSASFAEGKYVTSPARVTVVDGSLTIGVKGTRTDTWCIWDNFNLTYYGVDLSELQGTLSARLTVAEAITGKMNAQIAQDLAEAITEANNCASTVAAIEKALSDLNDAINAANTSIAIYAAVDATRATLDADGQASFDASEVGLKFAALTYVDEDCTAAFRAAALAQTTPGADMTLVLVNPTVDGSTGWTTEKSVDGNGPMYGTNAFEYWSYTLGQGGFDYYQVVENLPIGKYTVSAQMMNDQASSAEAFEPAAGVYAKCGATTVWGLVDTYANKAGIGALADYTSDTISVTNGTLRIGVGCANADHSMPARWFVADNFHLTFVKAITLQDYYDQIAGLLGEAAKITGKQSEATATALSEAVDATEGYETKTDIEILQGLIDDLGDAINDANASVQAYAALNTALTNGFYPDRSAAFGGNYPFTYRTEAQSMYDEGTGTTEEAQDKADGMLNAYRTYVKAIADNYGVVLGAKGARENTAWEYTTDASNNKVYNNPGNNDINGDTMWENWKSGGLTVGDMKQTVAVPNGKYFLRMVSFTRNSINANDYIYIKSGETIETSVSTGEATKPNAFVNITNPIEVTNGQVEIGFHVGSGADWAAIGGVVLYAYEVGDQARTTAAEKYGTLCLPYAYTATDATLYSAELEGNVINLTVVETPVAGTPYIYQAIADAPTFAYTEGDIVAAPVAADPLVGVLTATEITSGYVLQTLDDKQAFYTVGEAITVPAYRAYIAAPAAAGAPAALYFEEEATGIEALNALTTGQYEAIYDANGAQRNALEKGVNIVKLNNGKTAKVIVK